MLNSEKILPQLLHGTFQAFNRNGVTAMSKRGARLMAYVSAEEQLLDIYSPLAGDDVEAIVAGSAETETVPGADVGGALVENADSNLDSSLPCEQDPDLDPAVDSMLHVISDNSDIRSLISSDGFGSGGGFKGWDEHQSCTSNISDGAHYIYGLCRRMLSAEEPMATTTANWDRAPEKRSLSCRDVQNDGGFTHSLYSVSFIFSKPIRLCPHS